MDDEDDRRLLDIIGDVQALNDYLHGSNNKSIEEDDVANAAYGSASSFFTSNSGASNAGLKDGTNHLGEFGEAGGAGLQLSSSLQFIEDELGGEASPSGVELGGEDQPFDILQKSLLEADITEQTLAQEALLDSQPSLAPAAPTFPQQLVSGGFGGVTGAGVVAPLPLTGAQPQAFLQQVPQLPLPNGPTGHIQVVGSFNGSAPSMMTINSLERPQVLLRPGGNAVTGSGGQNTVFAPSTTGQVSMPFKGCGTPVPVQNIIIQRGPTPQTLVRSIQPKPLQTGGQTVYNISNLGLQPNATTPSNLASGPYTANGSPQTAQQVKVVNQASSIVVHSPLGQQGHQQPQSSLPQGQFLLPTSLALTTGTSVHGFQAVNGQVLQTNAHSVDPASACTTTYSILTNQNAAVQLIAGQNFTGGQLIVNPGVVAGGQMGQGSPTTVMQVPQRPGATSKVWTGLPAGASASPAPIQTTPAQSRLTVVNSAVQGLQARQQVSVSPGQRLLVPVAQNTACSAHTVVQELQFEMQAVPSQDSTSAAQKVQDGLRQTQLVNLLGTKAVKQECCHITNTQLSAQKRPAPQQLTRGGMILQQLRQDHTSVLTGDLVPFTSLDDIVHRLLPYHVFQGAPPCQEDFTNVDNEFEMVATHVLKRTQAMVNKYRRLLMVEAERSSPSSEMVMIDRTFNQEERSNLTQDKRMVLVDPDGFLDDFCCTPKLMAMSSGAMDPTVLQGVPSLVGVSSSYARSRSVGEERGGSGDPAYRTESHPGSFEDPGGGEHGDPLGEHVETAMKSILDMKKSQRLNINLISSHHAHLSMSPNQSQHSSAQLSLPALGRSLEQPLPPEHSHLSLADTDSVLEAAVNSILEC